MGLRRPEPRTTCTMSLCHSLLIKASHRSKRKGNRLHLIMERHTEIAGIVNKQIWREVSPNPKRFPCSSLIVISPSLYIEIAYLIFELDTIFTLADFPLDWKLTPFSPAVPTCSHFVLYICSRWGHFVHVSEPLAHNEWELLVRNFRKDVDLSCKI